MTQIKIPILSAKINRYSYGYSNVDDIESVSNWQDGNNVFLDVPDGTWYFFGSLKDGDTDFYFRKVIRVNTVECTLEISGISVVANECNLRIDGLIRIMEDPVFSFDLVTGYDYIPPVEELACEILANPHTNIPEAKDRGQHSYALVTDNVVCADLFSAGGQLNHDGTWVDLLTLGFDSLGRRFAGGKALYSGTPTKMKFRTREGCTEYLDGRVTEFENYNYSWKHNLTPGNMPNPANVGIDVFQFASSRPDVQANNGAAPIWVLWLPGHNVNLKARFNNGAWLSGSNSFADATKNAVPVTAIGVNETFEKDFLLDLSPDNGATFDRFVCRRWSTGGHYAVVTTCRRLSDNMTVISTTLGNPNVEAQLKIGGQNYPGGSFKNCFNLGPQTTDTAAVFNYPSTDVDWATIQLLF